MLAALSFLIPANFRMADDPLGIKRREKRPNRVDIRNTASRCNSSYCTLIVT